MAPDVGVHDSQEGFAEDDASQRRRRIRAASKVQVDQEVHRLKELWSSENQSAGIFSSYHRRSNYGASTSKETERLDAWKRHALEKTVSFPDPPRPPALEHYAPGALYIPQQLGAGPENCVQLDDYARLQTLIQDAPRYRLAERVLNLPSYPIPKPKTPTFPASIALAEEKPFHFRWYHYFMFSALPFERRAYSDWLATLLEDRRNYWSNKKSEFESRVQECLRQWEEARRAWDAGVAHDKAKFEELTQLYDSGDPAGVVEYFRAQLNSIQLPAWCPRECELQFDAQEGILLIEWRLPYFGALAVIKTRVLASGVKLVPATQREARELTNQFMYLIPLRLIWELPQVDPRQRLRLVCCNGYVIYDDPATGQRRRDVILSVATKREELEGIRLDRAEPEMCFRNLKGVAAAKIWELVPVQPLLHFNKNDKRFIAAKEVLESIADTNLATMDWQEFEHLIRELFEKEFASSGGEVRVTQASRDRGVDAVVFDPEPLRGGKLIVQAKRYTNTVDLSAVRDLYGTVINEGANKGILVTTSNYGRDAYDFAKDKPLLLINGANLLHLLGKHGYHKLRIDIDEAKRLLK